MSDKKVKVNMRINDLCGAMKEFQFDNITESEAKNCVKQLDGYTNIPQNKCIAYVQMYYAQGNNMLVGLRANDKFPLYETYNGKFDISILLNQDCTCNFEDCCKNIGTQKCVNNFARKIINEELFKNKHEQR